MRPWYLLLPLFLLAACQSKDPVQRGQATFEGFGCIRCHSVGYEGGAYGPDLTTIGFRKTKEWLDLWLKDPHGWRSTTVMPHFNLRDEIRADLVAYLVEQKGQAWGGQRPWDKPEAPTDTVKKGELIFQKAGCVACHGLGGAGGYPNNNVVGGQIPSLTKVVEGYNKEELKQRINHGKKSDAADPNEPLPLIFMPPWKDVLKADDIDAVADYLLTLGASKPGSKPSKDEW